MTAWRCGIPLLVFNSISRVEHSKRYSISPRVHVIFSILSASNYLEAFAWVQWVLWPFEYQSSIFDSCLLWFINLFSVFQYFFSLALKGARGERSIKYHDITTDVTTVGLVNHIFIILFLFPLKHWLAYDDLPPSWNFTERGKLHFSGLGTPPKETNYAFCQVWS